MQFSSILVMNNMWSQDLFYKAYNFASVVHNGQNVPGTDLPYIVHVSLVCGELMAVVDKDDMDSNLIIQCGALHDVMEDTEVTYQDIANEFGEVVANGVEALTKNPSLEKSIQIRESIQRILKQPKEIWMVKLADRITNLNPPPSFWTTEKKTLYLEDSKFIYSKLKSANKTLSERLLSKIHEYKHYI